MDYSKVKPSTMSLLELRQIKENFLKLYGHMEEII